MMNQKAFDQLATHACDECRKHKLKCSKEQPICLKCAKVGRQCVYGYTPMKRGPKPKAPIDMDWNWHKPEKGLICFPLKEKKKSETTCTQSSESKSQSVQSMPSDPLFVGSSSDPIELIPIPILSSNTCEVKSNVTFSPDFLTNCFNPTSVQVNNIVSFILESELNLDLGFQQVHYMLHDHPIIVALLNDNEILSLSYYFYNLNNYLEIISLHEFYTLINIADNRFLTFVVNSILLITDISINNLESILRASSNFILDTSQITLHDKNPLYIAGIHLFQLANLSLSN